MERTWSESDSQSFIDYGEYFVPERAAQLATIAGMIPSRDTPFTIVELCCGEGVLAEALLEKFPPATVIGYDLSPTMLAQASERLSRFGDRFQTVQFDLADSSWRTFESPIHAFVSSLAIHHLDDAQKATLYRDLYAALAPGEVVVIADVVKPATERANEVAAQAWDDAVREYALEKDGTTAAYDFFVSDKWNMYRHPDPMDKPSALFDQLKWLEAAGFGEVDVYWMRAGHAIFGGIK